MEKIKSKKTGAGLGLLLATTLAMASLPMIGCGDDGKEDPTDWYFDQFQGIDIYVAGNVSDTKAQYILDLLEIDTWPYLLPGEKTNFTTKVLEIYIKSGKGTNLSGGVLTICTGDTNSEIGLAIVTSIAANIKQKDGVMLALEKQNKLKQEVVLPQMAKIFGRQA